MPTVTDNYAKAMGIQSVELDGEIVLVLPFREEVAGRKGFIHGGAIGSLLEAACHAAFHASDAEDSAAARPVNLSVEFLRGAREENLYALGKVVRRGRRVSHVDAVAWQSDRSTPTAQARMHFFQ